MGSKGFNQEIGRNNLLKSLFYGKYECAIRLTGTDKETGEPKTGEYKLYEKFDAQEIISYAKDVSKDSGVKVSKIEILTLTPASIKEVLL